MTKTTKPYHFPGDWPQITQGRAMRYRYQWDPEYDGLWQYFDHDIIRYERPTVYLILRDELLPRFAAYLREFVL